MDRSRMHANRIGDDRSCIGSLIHERDDVIRAVAHKALAQSRAFFLAGARNASEAVKGLARVGSECAFLLLAVFALCLISTRADAGAAANVPGVAVLLVDTDRVLGTVEESIYGQFLEHINHSDEDGLFAEQIRGRGFEGKNF